MNAADLSSCGDVKIPSLLFTSINSRSAGSPTLSAIAPHLENIMGCNNYRSAKLVSYQFYDIFYLGSISRIKIGCGLIKKKDIRLKTIDLANACVGLRHLKEFVLSVFHSQQVQQDQVHRSLLALLFFYQRSNY